MKRTSGASETIGRVVENALVGREGVVSLFGSIAEAVGTLPALDDRQGTSSGLAVITGGSEMAPSSEGGIEEETGRGAH